MEESIWSSRLNTGPPHQCRWAHPLHQERQEERGGGGQAPSASDGTPALGHQVSTILRPLNSNRTHSTSLPGCPARRWQIRERLMVMGGEGNGTALQYSCLENPMDRGAWWAAVRGVAEGRTRLSDFTFTFTHWRRKWQPTAVFLPGESQGRRGSHRVRHN